jgi:hypothetical protein
MNTSIIKSLAILLVFFPAMLFAQQNQLQSGTIHYNFIISFDSDSASGASRELQPMTVTFNDEKAALYLKVPDLGEMRIIEDQKTHQTTAVFTNGKKKYYATADEEEMKKVLDESKRAKDSVMNTLNSFSTEGDSTGKPLSRGEFILADTALVVEGITCKVYQMSNALITLQLHVTRDLALSPSLFDFGTPLSTNSDFDMSGIEGFPLEYEMEMNLLGMKMQLEMKVQSFEANKTDDSFFEIPKGYKKISMSDLQNLEMD